jgi:hypothetical protein
MPSGGLTFDEICKVKQWEESQKPSRPANAFWLEMGDRFLKVNRGDRLTLGFRTTLCIITSNDGNSNG